MATLKVAGIFGSGARIYSENAERGPPLSETLLFILFYSFGIFVAHRCSSLGLRSVCYSFQDLKQLKNEFLVCLAECN